MRPAAPVFSRPYRGPYSGDGRGPYRGHDSGSYSGNVRQPVESSAKRARLSEPIKPPFRLSCYWNRFVRNPSIVDDPRNNLMQIYKRQSNH